MPEFQPGPSLLGGVDAPGPAPGAVFSFGAGGVALGCWGLGFGD